MSKKEKGFLEKIWFPSQTERRFNRIAKVLEKEVIKKKKWVRSVIGKNEKLLDEIKYLMYDLDVTSVQTINCFNEKIVDIVIWRLKEEDFINKKNNKEKLEEYWEHFSRMLGQNALFLSRKLEMWKISFEYKIEREAKMKEDEKKKGKRKGKESNTEAYNRQQKYYDYVFYEDIEEIVKDKNMSPEVINALFKGLVKNIKQNQSSRFYRTFEKVIVHPSLNKFLLKEFITLQMSRKDESWYTKINYADDIDFNYFKKIVIKSKVLEHYEIIPLTTLPYISLWEEILNNYFLSEYLISDFLDNIIKEDYNHLEKTIVQKFIASKIVPLKVLPTEARYRVRRFLTED